MLVLSACGNGNNGNNGGANAGNQANNGANAGQSNGGANDSANAGGEAAPERTVTDGMGHQVTIPAHPRRILASYLEDPVVTLGEKPVAQWSVANGTQDDWRRS
ncbi:hypothetical protein [Paenibacillus sp. UNC496MF]|uniref:hypothetical protein n=1 Tax=Paenibacillus sp. UNC496MF TaxID=1502753 RepID=UPI00210C1882|nr:hypothetical protein [Paenibacillus sp. UNC496MF]